MDGQRRYRHCYAKLSLAAVLGLSWTAGAETSQAAPDDEVEVTINAENNHSNSSEESSQVSTSEVDPADADITKDEAVKKLRTVLPALEEAEVQQVELRRDSGTLSGSGELEWDVRWEYSEGSSSYGFSGIVNAVTGDVIRASILGPMNEDTKAYYPPDISEEEAAAKAEEVIKTAVPSVDIEQLKREGNTTTPLESLFGDVGYTMNYVPYIDGVPASEQAIQVGINGAGEVTSFSNTTSPSAEYPESEPEVTKKEAISTFQDNVNIRLAYYTSPAGAKEEVFLGWGPAPSHNPMYIDAGADEFLNRQGEAYEQTDRSYAELDAASTYEPLETGEDGSISESQAVRVVQEQMDKLQDREPEQASLRQQPDSDTSAWQLIWQMQQGTGGSIQAEVDAATGQILTINQFSARPSQTDSEDGEEISSEALKEEAVSILSALYPDASEEFKLAVSSGLPDSTEQNTNRFTFQRFAGEIPVQNDQITITLNSSGELVEYRRNLTSNLEEKIEGLTDDIGEEAAAEQYSDSINASLSYQSFPVGTNAGSDETETKLVYQKQLSSQSVVNPVVNAQTGNWQSPVPAAAGIPEENAPPAKDIQGHESADALQTLVQYNVLNPDAEGNILPDETLTYGDWLRMAASAVSPRFDRTSYYANEKQDVKEISPDSPYYAVVSFADEREWLDSSRDTVDPDSTLTHEPFVQSMVRILGYDQFATHMTDETPPFNDADAITDTGSINTALQLNLISSSQDTFGPETEVTRAQAAEHMINMADLQSSIDQDIDNRRTH
ncbi:S-layer homology domain-containing protein [Salibacterium qingdaonense]|uniref:S-layer homology domain-containing protein n=1 Tax=Salibacterium qingdaonense TaxID=266892 RepID=A0A1I4NEG7_9BACI|nr:S-layer homology domain-containing protein [Salibacterium qingdaonense]SFM13869.1 S-layer homology domain-containing protein [Salibacterium qingdaonense]